MNTFFVFIAIWVLVAGLHAMSLLYFFSSPSILFLLVLTTCVAIGMVLTRALPRSWLDGSFLPGMSEDLIGSIKRFRDLCLTAGAVILVIEVFVSGGVPLYWMLTGSAKGYADFGIASLHGLFNALLLFSLTATSLFVLFGHERVRNIVILTLLLAVIVLLFNRGLLFIFGIQFVGLVSLKIPRKMEVPAAIAVVLAGALSMFAFGVIGNVRVGCEVPAVPEMPVVAQDSLEKEPSQVVRVPPMVLPDRIDQQTAEDSIHRMLKLVNIGCNPYSGMVPWEKRWIFSWIPTEFLWGYAYATTGLNNLIYNLDYINPSYLPIFTFAKLVPTAVYTMLGHEKVVDGFQLAHPAFTVSTAFSGVVADFGLWGILTVIPVLLISFIVYRHARRFNLVAMMLYSVLFQSIVLSPYVDTILYGPFLAQIILVLVSAYYSRLVRPTS